MEPSPSQDQILEAYYLVERTRNEAGVYVGNILIRYDRITPQETYRWWAGTVSLCRGPEDKPIIHIKGQPARGDEARYTHSIRKFNRPLEHKTDYLNYQMLRSRFNVYARSTIEMKILVRVIALSYIQQMDL